MPLIPWAPRVVMYCSAILLVTQGQPEFTEVRDYKRREWRDPGTTGAILEANYHSHVVLITLGL